MSQNRTWWVVLAVSVGALLVGFGAAWVVQQQKIDTAEKQLTQARAEATLAKQDLADTTKALDAAIAQRDKAQLAAAGGSNVDTSPRTPASSAPTPLAKPDAVTGKRFGYIKNLETKGGILYVTYDQAEFLTGKAAAAAATAHGDESPPPNDYYIVNDNKLLRTFPVASSAKVTLTTEADNVAPEGYPSNLKTLTDIFSGANTKLANAKGSPYWLTLKNGVVLAIAEQYLP